MQERLFAVWFRLTVSLVSNALFVQCSIEFGNQLSHSLRVVFTGDFLCNDLPRACYCAIGCPIGSTVVCALRSILYFTSSA